MEKYCTAGQATDGNTIRHTRTACWTTKATKTLRICNTLAFLLPQWLHELAPMFFIHSTHCLSYSRILCLLPTSMLKGTKPHFSFIIQIIWVFTTGNVEVKRPVLTLTLFFHTNVLHIGSLFKRVAKFRVPAHCQSGGQYFTFQSASGMMPAV